MSSPGTLFVRAVVYNDLVVTGIRKRERPADIVTPGQGQLHHPSSISLSPLPTVVPHPASRHVLKYQ